MNFGLYNSIGWVPISKDIRNRFAVSYELLKI